MTVRGGALWGLVMFVATQSEGARADIPPEPGYVEACTIGKVQKKGEFCTGCRASYRDEDACGRQFGGDKLNWEYRCRGRGASVWTEIWCAPWKGKSDPKVPEPRSKKDGVSYRGKLLPPVF